MKANAKMLLALEELGGLFRRGQVDEQGRACHDAALMASDNGPRDSARQVAVIRIDDEDASQGRIKRTLAMA